MRTFTVAVLLLFGVLCLMVLIGCAPEEQETTSPSSTYVVGYECAASGYQIDECALVCDKMGGSKAVCWSGFFDYIKGVTEEEE